MKKLLVVLFMALGLVGFAVTYAIAGDSEKAGETDASKTPAETAVLAVPSAVGTVADAAAPVVPGAVEAVADAAAPVVSGVADAAAATVAPIAPGEKDAAPQPKPKQ